MGIWRDLDLLKGINQGSLCLRAQLRWAQIEGEKGRGEAGPGNHDPALLLLFTKGSGAGFGEEQPLNLELDSHKYLKYLKTFF